MTRRERAVFRRAPRLRKTEDAPANHECLGFTEFKMAKVFIQVLHYQEPRGVCIAKDVRLVPSCTVVKIHAFLIK